MHDPILSKTLKAGAAVGSRLIVKAGSSDGYVIQATGATVAMFGVSDELGAAAAEDRCNVHMAGPADVVYGGTVTRGDPVCADANGKAVKADFAAGQVVCIVGYALVSGVANDIGSIMVAPAALANESNILVTEVTLTTAQIKALNATPIEVLATPGAGKAHVIVMAEAFYDYNSAAYAGIAAGEDLALRYTDGSGTILAQFETTGFLDQSTDQVRCAGPSTPVSGTNLTPTANAAVVAHMLVGEITTGDSPLKLRIWSRTIDTAW